MKAKKSNAVAAVVEWLTESHLFMAGGYPFAGIWIGDIFVYASVDGNETSIHAYRKVDLVDWYKRAQDWLKKNPEEDLSMALSEVGWPKEYQEDKTTKE